MRRPILISTMLAATLSAPLPALAADIFAAPPRPPVYAPLQPVEPVTPVAVAPCWRYGDAGWGWYPCWAGPPAYRHYYDREWRPGWGWRHRWEDGRW
jgi:hypothetical protein